jgi:hypothetical protein
MLVLGGLQAEATNANLSNWMKNLSEPKVAEQTGFYDFNPEIEISGSTVHVMWITRSNDWSTYTLYYKRSLDGGKTWQPKKEIFSEKDLVVSGNYKRMAVLGNTVHIAVSHYRDNQYGWYGVLTYFRSTDNGATFLAEKTLFNAANAYHVYDTFVSAADGKIAIGFRNQCNWCVDNAYHVLDSSDRGATFTQRTVYSTKTGSSWRVWDLKRYQNSIYVLYSDSYYYYGLVYSKLYLAASSNNGATFTNRLISVPSSNGNHKTYSLQDNDYYVPKIAASGTNVYVTWTGLNSQDQLQLFLRRSSDNGKTVSAPFVLSKNLPTGAQTRPGLETIEAKGNYVYVVFTTEAGDIYFRRSTDGGATYKALQTLAVSSGPYWVNDGWWPMVKADPKEVSGSKVHVLWNAPTHIYSEDGGTTFSKPALLSIHFTSGGIDRPKMAISNDGTVHWVATRQIYSAGAWGDYDIFYRRLPEAPQAQDTNQALNLNSNSDTGRYDNMQIRSSASTTFSSRMTLELWVKPFAGGVTTGTTSVDKPVVHKRETSDPWSGYALGTTAASAGRNPLAFINTTDGKYFLYPNYYNSDNLVPDWAWTHLAMTYNADGAGDNFKLYKNGKLILSTRATGKISAGQGLLMVGYYGNWVVDELRLWKTTRKQTEIAGNMNKSLKGTETGLVAYYPLNGTEKDQTGRGNDGVLMYRESFVAGKPIQ